MNEGKDKGEQLKQRGGHKPKPNHPWKRSPSSEVMRFAEEQSRITGINNFKIGGGKPQN